MTKEIILILLIFTTFNVLGQDQKIQFVNGFSEIDSLIIESKGLDFKNKMDSVEKEYPMNIGYLLIVEKEKIVSSSHSLSQCLKRNDTIQLTNYVGFMGGWGVVTMIYLTDSSFTSEFFIELDGSKSLKLNQEDSTYSESITIHGENVEFKIYNKPMMINNSTITGVITMVIPTFYELGNGVLLERNYFVESHFESKIIDVNSTMEPPSDE